MKIIYFNIERKHENNGNIFQNNWGVNFSNNDLLWIKSVQK